MAKMERMFGTKSPVLAKMEMEMLVVRFSALRIMVWWLGALMLRVLCIAIPVGRDDATGVMNRVL